AAAANHGGGRSQPKRHGVFPRSATSAPNLQWPRHAEGAREKQGATRTTKTTNETNDSPTMNDDDCTDISLTTNETNYTNFVFDNE
ncbi:MAG: hypothetical protein IJ892_03965, partial [Prevotella sp.]|nr:hypothetical protein [Prevotella sp.]